VPIPGAVIDNTSHALIAIDIRSKSLQNHGKPIYNRMVSARYDCIVFHGKSARIKFDQLMTDILSLTDTGLG
jgi:hypothetical protein